MLRPSVDFHTHILPSIDDGSSSITESIRMLKEEYRAGVKTVVLTPHFYPDVDNFEDFIDARKTAVEALKAAAKDEELPDLLVGAEVYYFNGIENWDILPKLAIEGTKYILIEMPHSHFSQKHLESLSTFKEKTGYTPIVAHLDRYITFWNTYGLPEKLAEMDLLVQVNASYFLRFPNKFQALKLLKEYKIHLLGSDCHNMTERKPNLSSAYDIIKQKLGEATLNRLSEYESLVLGK